MRIGVLGGSFNPVHIGHLVMAVCAREALGLKEVLLMPAGVPPHKRTGDLAPPRHRLAMLRLAIRGLAGVRVSTLELRRPPPCYTIDTVEALRGKGRLTLLVGADMATDLPNWRKSARLRRLVDVAAAARPGYPLPKGVKPLPMPGLNVSGADIRDRVHRGLPITFLVPRAVEEYILRHRLYR